MKDLLIILGILAILFFLFQRRNEGFSDNQPTGTLYFFYADWCGHSRAMFPAWEEINNHYQGSNITPQKVDVDTPVGKELAKEYTISGYPTIKLSLLDKDVKEYKDGDRSAKSIISWVDQQCSQ